jgi:ketol-acid reductoisomerase
VSDLDYAAITRFYAGHAQLLDAGRAEEWAEQFTEDGTFAQKWIKENEDGRPWFNKVRAEEQTQTLEEVGATLRAMMPFLNPVTHKPQEQNAPVNA